MAVDFASKQRDRGGKGWGLRNAKLRMSRKLIFASGLLVCFDCNLDDDLQKEISTHDRDINLKHLANHVWDYVNHNPLDIVASLVQKLNVDTRTCAKVFSAYDDFMGVVSDLQSREALKSLPAKDSRRDAVFAQIRDISKSFEEGLNTIFFSE